MIDPSKGNSGLVSVVVTNGRGLTPEECASMAVKKIISVSDDAPAPIRVQALEYATQIEKIIAAYMHKAVRSDRTTIENALTQAGHPELATAIKDI